MNASRNRPAGSLRSVTFTAGRVIRDVGPSRMTATTKTAWTIVALHAVLLFGWGFALNDGGGNLYCRLVLLPSPCLRPWAFTLIVLWVLMGLCAYSDSSKTLRASSRYAPVLVFIGLQLVASCVIVLNIPF